MKITNVAYLNLEIQKLYMIKIHGVWEFAAISVRYELFLMCHELHNFV